MSIRTLSWPDDEPEPPPSEAALLEQENQRLRQTVQDLEGERQRLQSVIRAACKTMLPYARER